ncbi:MAG: Ig-like domain-containing protein [Flavobacteriales bacterium]|nr:Ig-like domain-containing protein [Flavobacteriales bacterium]MCX7768256.1 Ig-like domain-containing protein [Flavobacteriales bacterium]MDW8410578.1 Ig-like domain-containing protein [Flavobacteriales bacterium]
MSAPWGNMVAAILKYQPALLISSFLLVGGCARIVPLSGGDLDTLPPRALRYTPDSAATNFSAKNIVIRFNEYIQLKDPNREILVSPPLEGNLQVIAKGRRLIVRLPQETLRPQTTYLIQFGNAVADLNEGNVCRDFFYVFSTGDRLDTAELSGQVIALPHLEPLRDVKVMLYPDTLSPGQVLKVHPMYYVRTDSEGRFRLRFLRQGLYRIAALKEENNTFVYDRPGEMVGFHPMELEAGKAQNIHVNVFREAPESLSLPMLTYEKPGLIAYPLSPSYQVKVLPLSVDTLAIWQTTNSWGDSAWVYFQEPGQPLTWLWLVFYEQRDFPDTLKVTTKFNSGRWRKGGSRLQVVSTAIRPSGTDYRQTFWIEFSEPVSIADPNLIEWYSGGQVLTGPPTEIAETSLHRVQWRPFLLPDKEYKLVLRRGALRSWQGIPNDSLGFVFRTLPSGAFCGLSLLVKDTSYTQGPLLVEILDEKLQRLQPSLKAYEGREVFLGELPAGRYRLRIIYDQNENGRWDTGEIRREKPPEAVYLISQTVELRAGFSQRVVWSPYGQQKKL